VGGSSRKKEHKKISLVSCSKNKLKIYDAFRATNSVKYFQPEAGKGGGGRVLIFFRSTKIFLQEFFGKSVGFSFFFLPIP